MLKPHLTGINWPVVPNRTNADVLALLYQFEQSQWWTRDRVRDRQTRQIELLLSHFRATSPFYAERLANAGIDPGLPLNIEAFRRIPPLTRADIQSARKALLSDKVPKDHGRILTSSSSGSTGGASVSCGLAGVRAIAKSSAISNQNDTLGSF